MNDPDFYVGYSPRAPRALGRFVRGVILGILIFAAAVAAALALAQRTFGDGTFEYGVYRSYHGVVRESPVPALDGYFLVAPGKHGAASLIRGLSGHLVDLQASLIRHDGVTMLEIQPGTIRTGGSAPLADWSNGGEVELHGEIVDSKCYLGVMNPGSGKVHRDCAARCISGGVPPALAVRQADGSRRVYVLTLPGDAIKDFIAEPVVVRGRLLHSGTLTVLSTSLDNLRRE